MYLDNSVMSKTRFRLDFSEIDSVPGNSSKILMFSFFSLDCELQRCLILFDNISVSGRLIETSHFPVNLGVAFSTQGPEILGMISTTSPTGNNVMDVYLVVARHLGFSALSTGIVVSFQYREHYYWPESITTHVNRFLTSFGSEWYRGY